MPTSTREPELIAAERALVRGPGIDAAVVERVLLHGDLRQLSPAQKLSYYNAVCEAVGLNPLTQPFAYLVLNNKEVLYAKREATEQLRFIHAVSIDPAAFRREVIEGIYVVTAPASLPNGRTDVSTGAVAIDGLKGEARANAMMKAETKAKRRVTLSICGLGMLDETEIDSIPNSYVVEAPAPPDSPQALESAPLPTGGPAGVAIGVAPSRGDSEQLPPGAVYITRVEGPSGTAKGFLKHSGQQAAQGPANDGLPMYQSSLFKEAEECCSTRTPVYLEIVTSQTSGRPYVKKITRVERELTDAEIDAELEMQRLAKQAGEIA